MIVYDTGTSITGINKITVTSGHLSDQLLDVYGVYVVHSDTKQEEFYNRHLVAMQ